MVYIYIHNIVHGTWYIVYGISYMVWHDMILYYIYEPICSPRYTSMPMYTYIYIYIILYIIVRCVMCCTVYEIMWQQHSRRFGVEDSVKLWTSRRACVDGHPLGPPWHVAAGRASAHVPIGLWVWAICAIYNGCIKVTKVITQEQLASKNWIIEIWSLGSSYSYQPVQ